MDSASLDIVVNLVDEASAALADVQASLGDLGTSATSAGDSLGSAGDSANQASTDIQDTGDSADNTGLSFGGMTGAVFTADAAMAVLTDGLSTVSDAFSGVIDFISGAIGESEDLAVATRRLTSMTGMSAESASSLLAVFDRYDVSTSQASMGIQKFSQQIEKTATETKAGSTALDKLGISVKDAAGNIIDTNELFMETADKMQGMADGADKTALAVTLFGRAGRNLIPLLDQGRDGIMAIESEAAKYGVTLDQNSLPKLIALHDKQKEMNEAIGGFKMQLAEQLTPVIISVVDKIQHWIDANGGIADIYDKRVKPVVKDVIDWLKRFVEDTMPKIIKSAEDWKNSFEKLWPTIKAIGDVIVAVIEIIGWLGKAIVDSAKLMADAINGMIGGIQHAWDWIVKQTSSLNNSILNAVNGFGNLLYNAGRDLINGLIHGISDMVGAAQHTVSNLGSSVVNSLKNTLGIHSPSTVFAEIGKNMGQGLVVGLTSMTDNVLTATANLVNPSFSGMSVNSSAGVGINTSSAASNNGATINQTNHIYQNIDLQAATLELGYRLSNA